MSLTKEQILTADDLPTREVEVPEWGGTVRVRTLTGAQRDEYDQAFRDKRKGNSLDLRGLRSLLVAMSVVDDAGNQMFTRADVDALQGKNTAAIERVFAAAQELSLIGQAQESAEKN